MRVTVALTLGLASMASGVSLVACIDLFHSTDAIRTACEIDAAACEDASVDFCSWSHSEALANAQRTCAWLAACEGPFGQNAFGSCVFHALLAYDCAANPNHPVRGTTRDLWACLSQPASCAAIQACVFPKNGQMCDGTFVGCATVGGTPPNNQDVRVNCVGGEQAKGENCALWEQTCQNGVCVAPADAGQCAAPNTGYGGIDCNDNGDQKCQFFQTSGASWAACLPSADAGSAGASCTPSLEVTCSQYGVALSCPTGREESVDCNTLLGKDPSAETTACNPGLLSPPSDWTSPCSVGALEDAADGGASPEGGCVEGCSGTTLTACYRGATFSYDCRTAGLTTCAMDDGGHAYCTPPPSPTNRDL